MPQTTPVLTVGPSGFLSADRDIMSPPHHRLRIPLAGSGAEIEVVYTGFDDSLRDVSSSILLIGGGKTVLAPRRMGLRGPDDPASGSSKWTSPEIRTPVGE